MIGETHGNFRITERIGAGGMGEVYRATDTRLKRDVAIKVLPAEVAQDPERLARFQREAEGNRALLQPLRQVLSLDQLEHQQGLPLHLLQTVDGGDVGVREGGEESRARMLAGRRSLVEAEAAFRDVLARRRRALPPGHPDVADSLLDLGILLHRRGDPTSAEPLLREAVVILGSRLPPHHWRPAQAKSALGACLGALGRRDEARALLAEALAVLEGSPSHREEAREASEQLAHLAGRLRSST